MRNTKQQGKLRFLIYGSKDHYFGICYELGMVEEAKTIKEVNYKLCNGAKAIIETCIKENLSNEILNTKPPLKYAFIFFAIPFIFPFRNFISKLRDLFSISTFEQNISELKLAI